MDLIYVFFFRVCVFFLRKFRAAGAFFFVLVSCSFHIFNVRACLKTAAAAVDIRTYVDIFFGSLRKEDVCE